MAEDRSKRQHWFVVVAAIGVAQIISWGTLFYTIAVLGGALREAAGVSDVMLYTSYSIGLIVSGLIAPALGAAIDRHGGRRVLAGGSVVAALACAALATVQGPVMLLVAWLIAGVAMAATLYDPAFATLHQVAGDNYRRAVTALTLFGGFASTVFWPVSQALQETVGVRMTLLIYAMLHLGVCLPLHVLCVPQIAATMTAMRSERPAAAVNAQRTTYFWLATALALGQMIASALAAHLIGLLVGSGLSVRDAVLIGTLFGPMQVVGRIIEWTFARRVGPIAAGTISFVTLAAALFVLLASRGNFALAAIFVALYGLSNGVMTIVRGTVPAELFGRDRYGALLGRLALPQFVLRAVAPAAVAFLLALDDANGTMTLTILAFCGVAATIAYRFAVRAARNVG
ncbi:MAG TPA: MFS transporter [Casimicrobiaceae bacterium]|nr:MFS transporter [Casimicrobiaceae bacterium]